MPGTYSGNIVINKNLTLISLEGYEDTIIEGDHDGGELGTIVVTNNTTGVQIGDIGQGFTIIGIDGPLPAVEKAAIYFQGAHSNAEVIGNKIMADGDSALMSEYNAAVTDFTIDSNIFGGQTFAGDHPAGEGTNEQFDIENVPRQLVVMGGGSGGTNTQRITFTNNTIEGVAGGLNIDGNEQGNTLVTIDADDSVITGNTFQGVTARWTSCLRARRPSTISGNIFYGDGLTSKVSYMYLENQTETTEEIAAENTFVPTAAAVGNSIFAVPVYNITQDQYYRTIQEAIDDADQDDVIVVEPGTYDENITVNLGVYLYGPNADVNPNTCERGDEAIITGQLSVQSNVEAVFIHGFTFDRPDDEYASIAINQGNRFITIENNRFIGDGFAVISNTGDPDNLKEHIFIVNNLIEGITRHNTSAFHLNNINHLELVGNVVKDVNYAGAILDSINELHVLNNYIDGTGNHGIQVAGDSSDVTIRGNTIKNANQGESDDRGAIRFRGNLSGQVFVTANTFEDCHNGIVVRDDVDLDEIDLSIEYNKLINNAPYDIINFITDQAIVANYNWWGSANPPSPERLDGDVFVNIWSLNPDFDAFGSDNHIGDVTEPVPVYDVTRVVLYLNGLANGDDLVIESRYGEYSITIPLDAIPEDIDILGIVVRDVNWWTDWLPEWIKGEDVADAPEGFQFMGKVYRFVMADASDGPPEADDAITQFAADITMVFYFDPDEVDDPDLLDVYWFDGDAWVALDGVVDMEAGTLTVEVNHWSDFVLMEGEDPVEEEPVEEDPEPETPETGTGIMLLIPLGLLALAGGVLIRRRV